MQHKIPPSSLALLGILVVDHNPINENDIAQN